MRYIATLALFLFFSGTIRSQSIHITGKVINEKKEAIEKVNVTVKSIAGGRIIAFTQTLETGSFELKRDVDIPLDSLELSFSCLGYAPQTQKIPNSSQPILVELTGKDFKLREVVVSPQKITQRHDTITYLVSAFSSAEDRTIGDVLKKMLGVEVSESGEIKYQGQSLNKFYIEGSDMLGGRYGLATNNISYKDVASVDIMENHQPVRALQDLVYSGSPAMNIKLKEDAKSRWAGTLKGGAGIPGLWIAEVFAMRFKAKTQSLNTYKGNNTGNESYEMNLFIPVTDFTPNANTGLPSYVQVSPSVASDIGSSRSTFNQTNNLTSNNLYKIGKDFDLVSEFTASFDRRESENVSQTTYFLGDEQVSIEDKTENATGFKKAFTGNIRLKSNQSKSYVNNNFSFNYDQNNPFIHTLGNYPNSQKASIENWKISNDFDILRRTGDKFFTFRSNNEYATKPQLLEVSKNSLPAVRENIGLSSFHSVNSLNYSVKIGKIRVGMPTEVSYQYRQIEIERQEMIHNMNINKLKLNITPSASYYFSEFHIDLSAPLFYQLLSLDHQSHLFYGVNPRLSLNWTISSLFKMRTSLSYFNNLPDESLFYPDTIRNDYRNLTAGYVDFSTGKSVNFSVNMEYKDIIKTLFANLGVGIMKRHNTKISGQDFEGDYIINCYYPENWTTEMLSVSGSVSKGLELINGTVAIYPLYVHNKSSILRNGLAIPYTSDSYSLRGMVTSRAISKCNLTYQVSYTYNKNQMEGDRQYFSSNRLFESLKISYSLLKFLQMNYTFDHYCNELSMKNYKNFIFSDISASYLLGNRWELTCYIKNMFNEKSYSYFIENELTSFYRSYKIRPRNVLLSATYRF